MIFLLNKSFRRLKQLFKNLAGNRWIVLHFMIAIGLIAGTSFMLQEGQPTANNADISVKNYPLVEMPQVSRSTDTFCLKDIFFALLGQ